MSTRAQRRANQQNAKRSTGPKTPEGKLASSGNNIRHGLAGRLILANLSPEDASEFNVLALSLRAEHAPTTPTETLLVDRMAESFYMSSRAIGLQSAALLSGDDSRLSLLLRYQTTHERAFHKCLNELAKLRKEKLQQQIGFESHQRNQEAHDAKMQSIEARSAQQQLEREFAAYMNAPMPRPVSPEIAAIDRRIERRKAEKNAETPAA